jgi:phosphatidylglycerophosphate synthase
MAKNKNLKQELYEFFVLKVETKFKKLKRRKDEFLRPGIRKFPKWLTANMLSVFRLVILVAVLAIIYVYRPPVVYFVLILLFNLLVDFFDGAVARIRRQVTNQGALLDKLGDRLMIFIIYLYIFSLTLYPLIFPLIYLEVIFLFIIGMALVFDLDSQKCERLNFVRWYLEMFWIIVIVSRLGR